ncbi:MAG: SH3 domain-containing protein [Pseudomonadota bacterium]
MGLARNGREILAFGVFAFCMTALVGGIGFAKPAVANPSAKTGQSGLEVPRFVSLKASRVNLRKGPGTEYSTAWVFRRAGLPVEVVREYELWREVRDAEGTTGWVNRSLLSNRRTGQILPWDVQSGQEAPLVSLLSDESDRAKVVAIVEAGVIADLHECDGTWCRVSVENYSGYIRQKKIWGIYPSETLK